MLRGKTALVLCAIVCSVVSAAAQETTSRPSLSIECTIDRATVAFGAPFFITVRRTIPPGFVADPWPREFGAVSVIEKSRESSVDRGTTRENVVFEARAYGLGEIPIILRCAATGPGGVSAEAESGAISIAVTPTLDADGLREIEYDTTPLDLPLDRARIFYFAAGGCLAALIVFACVHRFRRRARGANDVRKDAAAEALAKIAEWREKVDRTDPEAIFVAGTDALRSFIAEATGIRAPEMTTEEFLAAESVAKRLPSAITDAIGSFLSLGDRVKFGRSPTDDAVRRDWLDRAAEIVRKIAN